jgi:hypothetical protein
MPSLSELITAGTLILIIGFTESMFMGCNAETTDEVGGDAETNETSGTGDGDGDGDTGDGDGDGDTGDGDGDTGNADPYDPHACRDPSKVQGYPGLEGAFCSPPCTVNEDCPPGPAETDASCALADDGPNAELCVLICDPINDTCPNDSTCTVLPENPDTGLCTYPWP